MIPYAVKNGDIQPHHLSTFSAVCLHVNEGIKNPDDGTELTCHVVCELLARVYLNLIHYKGEFGKGWDHSWLVFEDDPDVIIDPYPWACGSGPILVTTTAMSPWRWLYNGHPADRGNIQSPNYKV